MKKGKMLINLYVPQKNKQLSLFYPSGINKPMLYLKAIKTKKNHLDAPNSDIKRTSPTLPNFNRRTAKITDPTVGASTWAFGNQKGKRQGRGLTIKTKKNIYIKEVTRPYK